jgi:DnaJ-class molecular chaperone
MGCGNHFTTFKNYDYCKECAINGSRYLKNSSCSECDGSGMIKFPKQKPRPCKLCALTKPNMNKTKKLSAEEQEEQF